MSVQMESLPKEKMWANYSLAFAMWLCNLNN